MMYRMDEIDVHGPVRRAASLLREGRARVPDIFIMFSDDLVKESLSQDDYEYWMSQKRLFVRK